MMCARTFPRGHLHMAWCGGRLASIIGRTALLGKPGACVDGMQGADLHARWGARHDGCGQKLGHILISAPSKCSRKGL